MSVSRADQTSTGRFAVRQGDKLLKSVSAQIVRTMASPGSDEVHDLRVAIRKFTRILVVLKPCFPRGESRRIRRGLKRIMEQAGSVRDRDIAMRLLTKIALSEPVGPGAAAIAERLQEDRDGAAGTLTTSLRRWVERDLPGNWRHAIESGGQESKGDDARYRALPIAAAAQSILPAMAKDHFRCGKEAAREDASAEEIHRFRISAKNLRYTLDFFAPLYGASLAGLLDQLKELQGLLGDINDCATVRRIFSRRKKGGEHGTKEILAALKKRQRVKTEEFRKHYGPEFSSAAALRRWKESLRKTGAQARAAKKSPKPPKPPVRRASEA